MSLSLVDPTRAAGSRSPAQAPLAAAESRDFRSFQAFLRASRRFGDGALVDGLAQSYGRAAGPALPTTIGDAMAILDRMTAFQLYQWMYRHLQQFKYTRNELGIVATVTRERARLEATLAEAAPHDELRLDPRLELPDYYRMVDFHQQPGGVWSDPLGGLMYEMGRRATVPQHTDPGAVYHILFDALPGIPATARVLDWGCGVGAGLIEWKRIHPQSDGYGVDVAAPCLTLAHRRAREAGLTLHFSQQALERLDFADGFFDLAFHMFMLHEIAPKALPAVLAEAARVLRPGGMLAGPEFHLTPGDPFQQVIQKSHAWTNNETYSAGWFGVDIATVARRAGFSKVHITPFSDAMSGRGRPGAGGSPRPGRWNLYVFEK